MVITRSQAGNENRNSGRFFADPPRSPSAVTSGHDPMNEGARAERRNERRRDVEQTDRGARDARRNEENRLERDEQREEENRLERDEQREEENRLERDEQREEENRLERDRIHRPDLATSGPSRPLTTKNVLRSKANSVRTHRSTASAIARVQYEAEEKLAAIRRQELQLEAELIRKKLAADMAALQDDSDENDEPEQTEQRVTAWLEENLPARATVRGESTDPYPLRTVTASKRDNTPPRREKHDDGPRARVEWDTPFKERSTTPNRSRGRGVEQLADILEKMMNRRPPPRQASELPLFSGAPNEWLTFKAAMEETTAIYNFTPVENLARLRHCLRGEAKEAVAPLLSVATPPEQIMKTLEQCFGRPEVMADRLQEELKRLPRLGGSATELNNFAVKVQNAVAFLKRIKRGYLHNPLLIRDILEKLNPHQRSRWYDYAEETRRDNDEPEIILLSEFLMREADRALKHGFCTSTAVKKENLTLRPSTRTAENRTKKPIYTVDDQERDAEAVINRRGTLKCPVCEREHTLQKCSEFKKKFISERWDAVKKAGLCFKCINGRHRRINCRAKNCGTDGCRLPHHPLLHDSERAAPIAATTDGETEVTTTVAHNEEVKLKICPVTVSGPRGEAQIYALFDEGSTVTLLDDKIAQAIGAEGVTKTLNMHGINADRREVESRLVKVQIRGRQGTEHSMKARTIAGLKLLSQTTPKKLLQLEHLNDLEPEGLCYEDATPQLLIGTDNWELIVSRELRIGKKNQPAASRTQLGWVIHGSIPRRIIKRDRENVLHVVTIEARNDNLEEIVKKHFDIDALGISTKPMTNEQDQRAIDIFEKTAKRREDGRYEVGLTWRQDNRKLPLSYNNALRRLKNLEHKLDRSPGDKQSYEDQVENLLTKGYAEECDGTEAGSDVTWYLPHFPVKNPNKPGKVRLVFDAAAKTRGVCLNDFLLEGPDLLLSLLAILLRFREEAVAVKADIQEMFLQIKIRKEDQPAQMFLWRKNREDHPTAYKMTSMIFGASCSPFIAHCVRDKNARDFAETHPRALRAITEAHYMDDYVDSYPSKSEAEKTIAEVDFVHQQAGFHLRGWSSNSDEVLRTIPEDLRTETTTQPITGKEQQFEKTLGMLWDSSRDVLKFNTSLNRVDKEVIAMTRSPTKRETLSAVMSLYDPLGLLSCYTITVKMLLQNLWRQELTWDEPLPAEFAESFARWLRNLEPISHLELPRSYNGGRNVTSRQLHIFCDASRDAYAAAAYWRLEQEDGEVQVILAAAKAKVAPLRSQTIPRMELQAALIGARLGTYLAKEHRWDADAIIFWTDARVVLHWIRNGSRRYTPYVSHRLGEIAELSAPHQWRWVGTEDNVADLATRSGYVPRDEEDPWFRGPEFLRKAAEEWPRETCDDYETQEEQIILHTVNTTPELDCLPKIERFSNYERLIRATATVLLFIERCRDRDATLNVNHLQRAEHLWQRRAQSDSFATERELLRQGKKISRSSPLYRLNPVYKDGLLVLDGRIGAAQVPAEMKTPVVLDGRHPFTRLLIAHEHQRAGHGNRERVVNDLRQKYWILRLRPTVRGITKNCTLCRLRRAKPESLPTGDLPEERLGAFQRPFSNCGLDYFGPMAVTIGRRHEKRWVALFTCLTTRAIHLELVASLSTDSAIMAIRRMAARRGWPATMYSDNGTNFRGADAELRRAYEEWGPAMRELGLQHRMQWKYIPPGAPNQGGAWERMVRSVKVALAATLNSKFPKEEVLQTLLTEAEYSVNARPLTHVSVDRDDPEALTPNHFLIGSSTGLPYVGPCEPADKRTWRATQALADEFWRRWVREYLPTLVPRKDAAHEHRTMKKGDLVIIVDPTLPRNTWPRGVIVETYPGPDGHVRSVDVRTRSGVLRRPTTRLTVLQGAAHGHDITSPQSTGEAA